MRKRKTSSAYMAKTAHGYDSGKANVPRGKRGERTKANMGTRHGKADSRLGTSMSPGSHGFLRKTGLATDPGRFSKTTSKRRTRVVKFGSMTKF